METFYKCNLWIFVVLLSGTTSLSEARHVVEILSNKILPENQPSEASQLSESNNVLIDGLRGSFEAAIEEMDMSLMKFDTPCAMYDPVSPNFELEGRRVSETKCLQHIWHVKKGEDTKRRVDKCRSMYANEFTGIVGGRKSKPGEFPHMGALGWNTELEGKWAFKCGSFLISEKFVLTAAHCFYDEHQKHPKIVRLGVVNISDEKINNNQPPVDIRILHFIKHPYYKPDPFKTFDIALVKLAKTVTFNEFIQPVCILQQHVTKALISGWGVTDALQPDKISDALQMAKVDVLPNRVCGKKWYPKFDNHYWLKFARSQMCATNMNEIADICAGDSGSPLQAKLNINSKASIYNAIGVTSLNDECGSHNFPSVYTRVSCFIDWIEEVVWGVKMDPTKSLNKCDPREPKNAKESETNNVLKIHSVQNFTTGFLFKFNSTEFHNHWAFINSNLIA